MGLWELAVMHIKSPTDAGTQVISEVTRGGKHGGPRTGQRDVWVHVPHHKWGTWEGNSKGLQQDTQRQEAWGSVPEHTEPALGGRGPGRGAQGQRPPQSAIMRRITWAAAH